MSEPLPRDKWSELRTHKQVREQITVRRTLLDGMVGRLYHSLIQDEIHRLTDYQLPCVSCGDSTRHVYTLDKLASEPAPFIEEGPVSPSTAIVRASVPCCRMCYRTISKQCACGPMAAILFEVYRDD